MNKNIDKEKSTFNKLVLGLNYVYKDLVAIPKDFITEIHLRFFRHNKNPNKKILGYWDFNQRLARLGDFILFLENLNLLRYEFNLNLNNKNNIDLCLIEDTNHYNAKQLRFSKTYDFKKNIKNLILVNPHIDSILIFKSNSEFNRFYQQNRKRYIRWPPTVSGSIAFDCRRIEKFYLKNKFIPKLNLPVEILSHIYSFYKSKVYPALPIILNIRNIPDRSAHRNPNLLELKKFLRLYEKNLTYKFIIICSRNEIPKEFRKLNNVIFSKDYFDGIEYDLAFIKTSYLSIFPGSGMSIFAWFSGVPFIQFGPYDYKEKYTSPPKERKLSYLTQYQRILSNDKISFKLINSTFEDLVNSLKKKDKINNNLKNQVGNTKKYDAQ